MPNPLMVLESANIFCGLVDPGASNHLIVRNVKLPALEEQYVDFAAGGAPVQIEIPTYIARLELTFSLVGFPVAVMTMLGLTVQSAEVFSIFGLLRDRLTGQAQQVQAIMTGRLARVTPSDYERGALFMHEYSIRGITRYVLSVGAPGAAPLNVYDWDFFESRKIVGGVDQNADLNAALYITGTPAPGVIA